MFLLKKQVLFAVLLCIGLGVAAQQHTSVNPNFSHFGMQTKYYHVGPGDNLWNLAGKLYGDPTMWRRLAEENGLSDEVFKGPKGKYNKNQEYCPLDESLVLKYYTFGDTSEVAPIQTPTQKDEALVPPVPLEDGNADTIALWVIASLMGLIILLYLILRFRREKKEREADPVGSGAPQVVGGVDEANATQRIMNIAEARGMTPLRVTNIQRGRLFGRGNVSYADVPSGLTKRFTGEVGYRGIILRTDATQETIYFLQGCGNDAQEKFFTNLRFVADEIQPEAFRAYNEERRVPIVDSTEESKGSTIEPAPKPFNSKEQTFVLADKIIEKGLETYFEVSIDGMKFKLDTTTQKKNQVKQVKPSDKPSAE